MSRLPLVTMTVVLSMVGSAFANDGTMLIYDLTELGKKAPTAISPGSEMFVGHGAPQSGSTPRVSPAGRPDLIFDWSGGDLELSRPNRTPRAGARSGFQSTPPQGEQGDNGATPTPEPGTLFLMGSGVAAGARFLRRRKAATD